MNDTTICDRCGGDINLAEANYAGPELRLREGATLCNECYAAERPPTRGPVTLTCYECGIAIRADDAHTDPNGEDVCAACCPCSVITKGPWIVDARRPGRILQEESGDIIATCSGDVEGAPTANALLISQAPALLAELRRAQAWVAKVAADYDGDGSGLGGRASKQLDRMVAVIAAATGEEDWL